MPQAEDFERSDYGRGVVGHFGVEINMSGKGARLNGRFWVMLLHGSLGSKARVSARQEQ